MRIKEDDKFVGIKREDDWLYFVSGDPLCIMKSRMRHGGKRKSDKKQKQHLLVQTTVRADSRFIYYVDAEGYLCKSYRRGQQ